MSTIPASQIVSVNPSVISAGGAALDVIGLILSTSTRVPIGTVQTFSGATSVSDFFGASSQEASLASIYFAGFDGSSVKPGSVLFAQYNQTAVAAYIRGGSGLSLGDVQALSGTLTVTMDGYARPGTGIDLSGSASFSAAAGTIQAALNAAAPNEASVTGSITGTTFTVTALASGSLAPGQTLSGTAGGIVNAGTIIVSQVSGSVGGTGVYTVAVSGTVGSQTIIAKATALIVTYDSVSGAFVITSGITGAASLAAFATGTIATGLELTSATGAVVSQGAAAASPAAFMNGIVAITTDWVTFMTAFDPDGGSGNAVKQAFAVWKNTQNNRYAYVAWDTDASPTVGVPATSSLGYALDAFSDSGTALVWAPDAAAGAALAAFVCGAAASIDFTQRTGRLTFAFKASGSITGTVTDGTVAANLGGSPQGSGRGNGYNFYGAYGAANADFIWYQRGFVTGRFLWLDSYINEIWLNSAFQVALLTLLQNSRSIPYNVAGNALIEAALADPIQAGLNFGAFAPGTISTAQQVAVNTAAGVNVSNVLQTQGYYLQVLPASSVVRAARASPPCTFWYLDRGSVQAINLNSVAVQ